MGEGAFGLPFFLGGEESDEEREERESREAKAEMASQDFANTFKRMLAEDLSLDQLVAIRNIFAHLTSMPDMAAWYQGCAHAAIFVREMRTTDDPVTVDPFAS